jgi:MFS family permease
VLVVSLRLTMFAYALDEGITYRFNAIAASVFSHHAKLGAVNTASAIIRAISKPFLRKLAGITSRPTTYVVVLVVYAVGFAVAASSQTLAAYIVGISFTAFGKSELDLLSVV